MDFNKTIRQIGIYVGMGIGTLGLSGCPSNIPPQDMVDAYDGPSATEEAEYLIQLGHSKQQPAIDDNGKMQVERVPVIETPRIEYPIKVDDSKKWVIHELSDLEDGYVEDRFISYPCDIDGDGDPDLVHVTRAGKYSWLENPSIDAKVESP